MIYVSLEIERALGMTPSASYRVITNRTPHGESVKKQYPEFVTLVEGSNEGPLSTSDLLRHGLTREVFDSVMDTGGQAPSILVFKNTTLIESVAKERGWKILNPAAALADKIEGKESQIEWLGDLAGYLPPHTLKAVKEIVWKDRPFILQWAHGHTGGGTMLVGSAAQLLDIQDKFPERMARISAYIEGPSFTANIVVAADRTIPSSPSYQITGLAPFTDNPFTTVGNDWGAAKAMLTATDKAWISEVSGKLGDKMRMAGWRGLFGIDMIRDQKTGQMYLIELNARQPASTTYESSLQRAKRAEGDVGMTTFEAHLSALLGEPVVGPLIEVLEGAQIVQRVTKTVRNLSEDVAGSLELAGYTVITYSNTEKNADLVRIQSTESIIASHGELNDAGKDIVENLS